MHIADWRSDDSELTWVVFLLLPDNKGMPNEALHRTAISLCYIATGELWVSPGLRLFSSNSSATYFQESQHNAAISESELTIVCPRQVIVPPGLCFIG
jgi:hypothetical protein